LSETRARVDEWIDLHDESDTGFLSEADAETVRNAREVLTRLEGRLRDAQLADQDDTLLVVEGRDERMTTSAQIREAIAEHLEYQSEWRAQKAEEYPEDDRNRIVADALARAAAQVRLLPDSDWNRFARLAKLADDRSIDASTLLSFSDETGEDVTSALHYGNEPGGYNAEAFSVETLLDRIDRATVESWMNEPA
jgi:hypothetical protein